MYHLIDNNLAIPNNDVYTDKQWNKTIICVYPLVVSSQKKVIFKNKICFKDQWAVIFLWPRPSKINLQAFKNQPCNQKFFPGHQGCGTNGCLQMVLNRRSCSVMSRNIRIFKYSNKWLSNIICICIRAISPVWIYLYIHL